jgi:RHS repeat-associated protein
MDNEPGATNQTISLPKGGGALHGIGEKFFPDLHTGTGNFTVPVSLPPGRNGFQPQLNLVYSTGNANGAFGLGWDLSIPGVSRKTSKGVPHYDDARDVFILSGAEDLVAIETTGTATRYRPRTEGLFARILYHRDPTNSYWEVQSKDGLVSFYGTRASFGTDPAVIADPSDRTHVFAWKLTHTEDPFGNRIEYEYERDTGEEGPHHWDQLNLAKIRYVDYGDNHASRQFLVTVEFVYELRPDPHSDYRAGFEIRTRKRCTRIVVHTHDGEDRRVCTYDLIYLDRRPERTSPLPINGVSLLSQIKVTGHDGEKTERLPPLELRYTDFEPEKRDFFPLQGRDLPARSLANPDLELVDLFGNGLPDLIEMNGRVRYWRNLGGGRFDLPRFMQDAPAGLALSDSGVQFIDANGDGRMDLLVTTDGMSGYFPLRFNGQWDRRSFQRYRQAPSFNLKDPEVKLVDLDGDGVTDAVRFGRRLECFFNDSKEGWNNTRWVERQALAVFPNINLADPRVKWADLTGDGLQDIALVYDGNVEYWPNLGHGNWGKRIHMENSPRFPYGYDPRRILVGDVDGDGLADIVYVDDTRITLWVNQSGNRWSDPITILGTPPVSDMDAVRLVDVLGSGISGVLWSRDANGLSRDHLFFFDFTGGLKPYLLNEMDNHIGAITKVEYTASTHYYLEDQRHPESRWNTTLPFPVQVVSRVEVIDHFSKGKLTTAYRYHQGHWDGAEREFHGFGMVEQLDTESFEKYDNSGLHGTETFFARVDRQHFSPPTLRKTWFHLGPVGDEFGDWQELDWSNHYWKGDPQLLKHTETVNQFLQSWPPTTDGRRVKRDALRALRGSILRTELYALDGSEREERPYTVSESSYGLIEVDPPPPGDTNRWHVFFPPNISTRTTQWERGDDPMTQFSFTRYTDDAGEFDPFGRPLAQTQIACPRGWRTMSDKPTEPYLATRSRLVYAAPNELQVYMHNRVAKTTSFEIVNTSGKRVIELAAIKDSGSELTLIGQTLSFYDGAAFVGLPLGALGKFGALTRSESLVLTDKILQQAYGAAAPPYLEPAGNPAWTADYPAEFRTLLPRRAGYTFHAGSADSSDPQGYFVNTDRRRYDFQTHPNGVGRGLELETLDPLHDSTVDPLGHRTRIAYDAYQLFPKAVTDAAGLTTEAEYDYRVMRPKKVTDPNGNQNRFTFSPLGLLASTFICGKTPAEGDQERPSVRLEYGFLAYENSPPGQRQPIYVRSIRHIHHDMDLDVPQPERDETITTIEYSDGFGRLLQTRTQSEEMRFGQAHFGGGDSVLPAQQSDGAGGDVVGQRNTDALKPNVVVSGWQVYDNKGQVVEKYEPFFSEGWDYGQPADSQIGQKVTLFYDPRGQLLRTLDPNGAEQRVIYGVPGTIAAPDLSHPDIFAPTPWEAYTYDANDNAGRTHPTAAMGYQHHWNTPTSVLIDALGRAIDAVERNRDLPANAGDPPPPMRELHTRTTYDIRGNVLMIFDALGRAAFHSQVYDYANNKLRLESIDAGLRMTVLDAAGGVIEQRDSKGALILHSYDPLHRPVRLWARDGEGQKWSLRERLEYGDAGSPNQSAADRTANRATNRLGRLARHFDEAGLLTFDAYDFKGNLLEKTRRVVSDAAILSVFSGPPPDWKVEAFRVDWTTPGATTLHTTSYVSQVSYDALNRVKLLTYPEDVENGRRKLRPRYNRAGALESTSLERPAPDGGTVSDTFVERIAYNAKGQRVLIAYGNGVMTRYAYDSKTFRLMRLRSEKFSKPTEFTYRHTGAPLQEFAYEFDLTGNMLKCLERTPGCGVTDTPDGQDALKRVFTYDALYRLLSATGRESTNIPSPRPWTDEHRNGFNSSNHGTVNQDNAPHLTRLYKEEYRYDPAGNLLSLQHSQNGTPWVRRFGIGGFTPQQWQTEWSSHFNNAGGWANPPGNRLTHVGDDQAIFPQTHFSDANGNVTRENTSRHFEWDYADRMKVFRNQTQNAEPTLHTHYLYDADGQRVKTLVRKQGRIEATVYIDGIFEYQRIVQGGATRENNTLHVMDSQSRIALVRVGTPFPDDTTPAVQYHLGDHLGSSTVVVDSAGNWVNREEDTPYGETSFGSFARKRYRFTGKERDEESGLYYFGARYYAPWLGRWVSSDPLQSRVGRAALSAFQYVANNPMTRVDPFGLEDKPLVAPPTNATDSTRQRGSGTQPAPTQSAATEGKKDPEVAGQQNLSPTQAAGGGAPAGGAHGEAAVSVSANKENTGVSPSIMLRQGLAQRALLGKEYRLEVGGSAGWTGNRDKFQNRSASPFGALTLHAGPKEGTGVGVFITGGRAEGWFGSITPAGTLELGKNVEVSGNVVVSGAQKGEVVNQEVGALWTLGLFGSATFKMGAHSLTLEGAAARSGPLGEQPAHTQGQSSQVGVGGSYQYQDPSGKSWGAGVYVRHEFDASVGTGNATSDASRPITTFTVTIGVSDLFRGGIFKNF